jgi:energy-coupling factor transport system ATP-binding protein
MSQAILTLNNVTYRYPHAAENAPASLADISLTVAAGEFVGLVGANGSGKTTLARLLNGLITPTAGEVVIDGLSTGKSGNLDRIRETVGMVFQNPESQIVAATVEDDIAFGLENIGLPPVEIDRRVAEAARRFGVAELLAREPHWLSGGQKQRTVLAGVVALGPRVLVLDEPTSMLDPRSQHEFRALIEELWREGTTVIYITHLMEEVAAAPRLVALAGGSVAFDGAPREFFSRADLLERTSLVPPLPVRLGAALASRGHSLPVSLSLTELVENLCG